MQNSSDLTACSGQRKVLALHDLSCFGRSSLVPITAVLSAMGHQCVPAPTAVFSTHTAISGWVCTDLTPSLSPTLEHFQSLGLRFDAVYSGFLSTADQIDCVAQAARLKAADGLFLVDPVMGDNGKVYQTYTAQMTARMGELCTLADLITPNVTEAALLLGYAPQERPADAEQAADWCRMLAERYRVRVVLTGLSLRSGCVSVGCCDGQHTEFIHNEHLSVYYPGTGDLFSAVLLGGLLRGRGLTDSAGRAARFVHDAIAFTAARSSEPMWGVQFEPLLHQLTRLEDRT